MFHRISTRLALTSLKHGLGSTVVLTKLRPMTRLCVRDTRALYHGRLQTRTVFGAMMRFYSTEVKWTNDALDEVVKNNKIVVFMKGTPLEPMCGFSKAVVTILQMHGIVEFSAYNVLKDEDLRQKVKEYSSWPTVPQVYIDGEFVGGCDIMIQLHQSGELIKELEKVGFRSILADEVD